MLRKCYKIVPVGYSKKCLYVQKFVFIKIGFLGFGVCYVAFNPYTAIVLYCFYGKKLYAAIDIGQFVYCRILRACY